MLALSELLGSEHVQVLIRIPMFVYYVALFILLVKDINLSENAQKTITS